MELAWVILCSALLIFGLFYFWRPVREASREAQLIQARKQFHFERERLEAKFIQLANTRSFPSGPHWVNCDFCDDVCYVKNRSTGELCAFVGLSVASDLKESLSMVEHVDNDFQLGTAVFRFPPEPLDNRRQGFLESYPCRSYSGLPKRHRSGRKRVRPEKLEKKRG